MSGNRFGFHAGFGLGFSRRGGRRGSRRGGGRYTTARSRAQTMPFGCVAFIEQIKNIGGLELAMKLCKRDDDRRHLMHVLLTKSWVCFVRHHSGDPRWVLWI